MRGGPGRKGTALIEFVMAVPLLALVIMLIFFFGWSLTKQQHVKIADRYVTWRQVANYTPPQVPAGRDELNVLFFRDRALTVGIAAMGAPDGALEGLVDASGDYSQSAEMFADLLVLRTFPRGRKVSVGAQFRNPVTRWSELGGMIRARHAREGLSWRYPQVGCERALAEQPLSPLDDVLCTLPPPADISGEILRGLYLWGW